jgi:hypothetical protein
MNNDKDNEKSGTDRRNFLTKAVAGGAGLAMLAATQGRGETPNSLRSSKPGRRKLGKLEVSEIGMGVQNMHRRYETTVPYRPDMIAILRAAYDRGITFFDCAEAYGPWENERILGEAIQPFRNKVKITTKFGWNIDPVTGRRLAGLNSRPEHIKQVVEGSLKRLRTDRIDLLYQHRVDPAVPIEEVAGAIKDMMDQGKVLHWGLSEPGIQTIRRAHATVPLTAIQKRIFDGHARPGEGCLTALRRAGNRFCALVAPRLPIAHRLDRSEYKIRSRRPPWSDTQILAGQLGRKYEARRSDKDLGDTQEGNSCTDRPRVAAWAKTLDRADPRNDRDAAHDRKQRSRQHQVRAR